MQNLGMLQIRNGMLLLLSVGLAQAWIVPGVTTPMFRRTPRLHSGLGLGVGRSFVRMGVSSDRRSDDGGMDKVRRISVIEV